MHVLVLDICLLDRFSCNVYPPQVPPGPAKDQPEGVREGMHPPVTGVTGPGRVEVQDPHHFDVAYQDVVAYHPQPLVSVMIPTYLLLASLF